MKVRVDKVICKNMKYEDMEKVSDIVGINLNKQTDYWIDYDTISIEYPSLCTTNLITSEEMDMLEKEKADYIVFRVRNYR